MANSQDVREWVFTDGEDTYETSFFTDKKAVSVNKEATDSVCWWQLAEFEMAKLVKNTKDIKRLEDVKHALEVVHRHSKAAYIKAEAGNHKVTMSQLSELSAYTHEAREAVMDAYWLLTQINDGELLGKVKKLLDLEVTRVTGTCLTDYSKEDQQELLDIWHTVKNVGSAVKQWTST